MGLPEVDDGVVILEHVNLVNVLEGLNTYTATKHYFFALGVAYRTS